MEIGRQYECARLCLILVVWVKIHWVKTTTVSLLHMSCWVLTYMIDFKELKFHHDGPATIALEQGFSKLDNDEDGPCL